MRLMIFAFAIVLLVLVDTFKFNGYYRQELSRIVTSSIQR